MICDVNVCFQGVGEDEGNGNVGCLKDYDMYTGERFVVITGENIKSTLLSLMGVGGGDSKVSQI